ncbi:helix-hairpin-helix protein [Balneicella halophila]|uniref:Helix-hairpin-helix protein n=1 Tax=Balneicella halophila TaxID=1537566 RepID=A0A7L4UNP8_BALHA|nr:helix-hairpin-helix domain-containing protein [Balneicella halophila]PVX49958.1 helix-hairpin-helix protein [Balneicella halophila]
MRKFQLILFCLVCFLLLNFTCKAQDLKDEVIERLLEDMDIDEEADYTTLIQELYELYDNPLNINEITADQLEMLPMLSQIDIINLINYRNRVEQIYTIYELNAIEGFTPTLLKDLQHFVVFEAPQRPKYKRSLKEKIRYTSNSIMLRGQRVLEKAYGYSDLAISDFDDADTYENWQNKRYLGSPWRYYLRYETRYKDEFKMGLVAEKDPGEEFFSGTQKRGFDHYAGFIQFSNIGFLKTAIVGDYTPRFGQGLATWGGYSMGKSGYFLNVNKRNEGIKKYASTNENQYMRGVAITVEPIKRLLVTAYFSSKKIDGNIKDSSAYDNDEERFTSFLTSGYHRNHNELGKRKVIGEEIWGFNTNYFYKNLRIGLNFIDYKFSKPFSGGSSISDFFDFSGDHGRNYSIYANYRIKRLYFFGEAALDLDDSKAFLGGAVFNATDQLNFSMVYRDYGESYQGLYSSGFGDKSGTKNERGWYIGMEMLPFAKWKLSAYFDTYEFPWLRLGIDAPARGHDYKLRLAYHHSRQLDIYGQFYHETNQRNTANPSSNLRYLTDEKRTKVRLQLNYQVMPNLYFRDRGEMSFYKKEDKDMKGIVLFHDVIYKNAQYPLSFSMRYALFDVEDYNARIYTYENDVLYAFSTPALQNKGIRFYLNAKWDINKHFTLWAKYAITRYSDRETISSGLNLIDGNQQQEIKLQIRYKF